MKDIIQRLLCSLCLCGSTLLAQVPAATVTGEITDPARAAVAHAKVELLELDTGARRTMQSNGDGQFYFSFVPVGTHELRIEADGFAPWVQRRIELRQGDEVAIRAQLSIRSGVDTVDVTSEAVQVRPESTAAGKVVSGREIIDLPLNGRDFTQLGLLQPGVAPLTSGLVSAGGSIRAGQAYVVNGMRPESNNYLLDGAKNVNRMDGGYAIRVPVDAIEEFKIITHTGGAEIGGTGGATTSVVTRSGSNNFHGGLYYFGRNDVFDARNTFAATVEPLKQHQYGATLGGPIVAQKLFFFAYWEGFRNAQGITKSATVPTAAQRQGDWSGVINPATGGPFQLLNLATGQPFPDNKIPAAALSPISQQVLSLYPLPNRGGNTFTATQVQNNSSDQGGTKIDWQRNDRDRWFLRYAAAGQENRNPLSVRGADVPGFPVGDEITTHSAVVSNTRVLSPTLINVVRLGFFRNDFLFDKRFNHTPASALGFDYSTTYQPALGPPFFNIQGYATAGNPITGPRTSVQNTYEAADAVSWVRGNHTLKLGGEFRRTQINASQGIASNGFFVFSSFPANDAFASFLLGRPVVFFQAGGDMQRGLRNFDLAGYAQDEWRISSRFTLNYGVRYEISSPFAEIRDRINAFVPGVQSQRYPQAPLGVLIAGDPGIGKRVIPMFYKGIMPRIGFAWDASGSGKTRIRSGYGLFYDQFSNGTNQVLTVPISTLPDTQATQVSGPTLNYQNPFANQPPPFQPGTFPRPSTILALSPNAVPPSVHDWNFAVEQQLPGSMEMTVSYIGTKGTHIPRYVEANPAVFGPGASANNADARRLYAGCTVPGQPCALGTTGVVTYSTNSTYHAAQVNLTRRFRSGNGFQVSYWFSKSLDYVSSMSIAGSAPRLIGGENDLAQNPFNLAAEHGPSLFDARHRFTFSGSWRLPRWQNATGVAAQIINGWQLNTIASYSSATPFTVYDSANVSLQGTAPPITGFYSSRPNSLGNANDGPHTADAWMSRSAFQRLNVQTQAGQFGNLGRNTVRGPNRANLDLSLFKDFKLAERAALQLRFESFNVTNRVNLSLPVNDIASLNFGRILEAGSPRVWQMAAKISF